MPSAYTHLVFAEETRKILHDTEIPSLPMYWIGAQGPDVFFFSHMGIMPGTLHKYGSLMHSKKVPETFSFLCSHCMEDDELRSYLYGFMTHYGLDCRAHELIVSAAKLEHEKTGYPQGIACFAGAGVGFTEGAVAAALTITEKSSALSDAPPIRPPSTSTLARSSAAFLAFIEPPY